MLRELFKKGGITVKKFIEELGNLHNDVKCPICGTKEWGTLPIHGKIPVGDDGAQSVGIAIKFCTGCGLALNFMRLNKG